MAFMHQKDDFIMEAKSVDCVFSFNNGIHLKKDYCEEFCVNFGAQMKCPIKMDRQKSHINSFTFNVSCIINNNIQYSLKCYKEDIIEGQTLNFEVMGNSNIICEHGTMIEGRQLRGSVRKEVQKKLLTKTPKQVRNEAIANLNEQQCKTGNMTSVHPLVVYQKARSETLSRNDLGKESVTDLQKHAMAERENGQMFIQHIAILPFSVILFCEDNLKVLHQALKTNKKIDVYLDATGGIVRRISANNLLNHCLVFPIKSNTVNKSSCILVLAELITEDNCSYNIENFLRIVKTKFQLLFKDERMFRSIVTDKSYANINAIIQSQNRITFSEYIKKMYDIRMDRNELTDITFVFLCSSHLGKVWKADIEKCFAHLDKEDVYFLCGLIGNAMNIRRYEDLKIYLQNLIKFFLHKNAGSEYETTLQRMKDTVIGDDNWIYQINSLNSERQEHGQYQSNNLFDHEPSKALYKQSPFFIEFQKYMDGLKLEDEEECLEINVFYSPAFIKHFLKNSIAILPLWSAVYFSNGYEKDDQLYRPNNGFVEGHFSSLKNFFRTNLSWGKLGTIKIGRYIEALKENNQKSLKEIALKIPNKHVSRKQKETSLTNANLSAEREQWRGKSKKSSTIMFNRENLIQKLDSGSGMHRKKK